MLLKHCITVKTKDFIKNFRNNFKIRILSNEKIFKDLEGLRYLKEHGLSTRTLINGVPFKYMLKILIDRFDEYLENKTIDSFDIITIRCFKDFDRKEKFINIIWYFDEIEE